MGIKLGLGGLDGSIDGLLGKWVGMEASAIFGWYYSIILVVKFAPEESGATQNASFMLE